MHNPAKIFVGIGASAGGLRALERFFEAVPADSGCCFVVVQHLSPDFKSIMEELLARKTRMPVVRIKQSMRAAPNTVFLIPPKKLLTLKDGRFQLSTRDIASVAELPIDAFFKSLASEVGANSVGIVLSGGGSDGAAGLRAISDAGGMVIVQRPETAEFESMPRSALAAAPVDQVLLPEDMPAVIVARARELSARAHAPGEPPSRGESASVESPLAAILALLRQSSGIDFKEYKISTIERRIERRMALRKARDMAAYARLLSTDAVELDALYGDMLIGVTEFFRDARAFEALSSSVVPAMLAADRRREMRIWVAACATGQEAYSLAILFDEVARATEFAGTFTFFATDIHRASLEFAAAGVYEQHHLKNLSAERIARYFTEEIPGKFRISPDIRKRMVFAPHNLVSDPPFTKLDFISCRNLLIYFNPALQERAVRLFHFSLCEGGTLFLGPSEGIGKFDGIEFEVIDGTHRIFRKLGGRTASLPRLHTNRNVRPFATPVLPASTHLSDTLASRQLLAAYDQILRRHAPTGLLVNESFEVLHYFGHTERYLRPLEGRARDSILNRVEGDLRLCLSTLLPRVFKSGESFTSRSVHCPGPEGDERIDVIADPIVEGQRPVSLVHVSLVNARHAPLPVAGGSPNGEKFVASEELLNRIHDLETELQSTRENLQAAVEELQASNEELQASNEELTASNEELQSTNEEFTAVNEELYTVNAEFERKNAELQALNDDLNNLSNSTDVGTVFVDRDLRIRKFNPAIQKIFRVLPRDVGRPLDHIAYHLGGQEAMIRDVRSVLEDGQLRQKEVRTRDGHWLLKRALPFLSSKGTVEGVVLTFTDIDEVKALQDRLDLAISSTLTVWWEWTLSTGKIEIHCGNQCILGYTSENLPRTFTEWEAATHEQDLPRVRETLKRCLDRHSAEWSCEHRFRRADGSWAWVLNTGRVTERDAQERPLRMLGTTQDVHKRRTAEDLIRRDADLLSKIKEAIICTDCEGIVTYWSEGAVKLYGWTAEEMMGHHHSERLPHNAEVRKKADERLRAVLEKGEITRELNDYRKDGSHVWTEARLIRTSDGAGMPTGVLALCHDISARKREEKERRELEQQLLQAQKMDTMGTLAGGIAHDFNNILATVIGCTELAMQPQMSAERTHRMLESVLKAGHRAKELVNRILTFSRFHESNRVPVRLDEVIREAVKFARAGLPATIELVLDLEEKCPPTVADPNQLHQIIINLAANSAYAMRESGGRLALKLQKVAFGEPHPTAVGMLPAGDYVAIEVADTGHGIKPDALEKIFDPFFTTKPVGEGTGLGLSIVHGIVKGHDGGIDVSSKVGVGTTFTIYLPVIAPTEGEIVPVDSPLVVVATGTGQRIAVIDDEEDVGIVTQTVLSDLGYDVSRFTSAEGFYGDYHSVLFPFDLIITDQTMPKLTGLDLARKLREAGHKIPVVIVSGYSSELTEEAISSMGDIELLRKPYDRAQMAELVRQLLSPGPSRNGSQNGAPKAPS